MRVFIDAGHGGPDVGAVKYIVEKDVNLTMALACRDYLKLYGVTTKLSRTKDTATDLNKLCADCNAWRADYAISCHNNAGGGDGFEVIHQFFSAKSRRLAKNIETEVKKIGQNSRGLKTKRSSSGSDYFAFNRLIKCPSVICEGVFVDNKTDVKIADTIKEQKAFGYAYAKGVLKDAGIKIKTVYITDSKLNLRPQPNLNEDNEPIMSVPKGTMLIVSQELEDGWIKVTYKGKKGYIRSKSSSKQYCTKI